MNGIKVLARKYGFNVFIDQETKEKLDMDLLIIRNALLDCTNGNINTAFTDAWRNHQDNINYLRNLEKIEVDKYWVFISYVNALNFKNNLYIKSSGFIYDTKSGHVLEHEYMTARQWLSNYKVAKPCFLIGSI